MIAEIPFASSACAPHGLIPRGERADADAEQLVAIDPRALADRRQPLLQRLRVRLDRERAHLHDELTLARRAARRRSRRAASQTCRRDGAALAASTGTSSIVRPSARDLRARDRRPRARSATSTRSTTDRLDGCAERDLDRRRVARRRHDRHDLRRLGDRDLERRRRLALAAADAARSRCRPRRCPARSGRSAAPRRTRDR